MLRPAFKCHGGKRYLAPWIISHFPENYEEMVYVEPFLGAGSVFLNKKPAVIEIINDLDKGIVSIFHALRDDAQNFIHALKQLEYAENTFATALKKNEFKNEIEHAINEFILRRMSRGGLKKSFGWSDRERGGQPGDVNAWKTILKMLPTIANRLTNVRILNKDAKVVIGAFNSKDVILYCDPPYLPETRVSTEVYGVEMNTDDHIELSKQLMGFKGKAIISGYPCQLYNRLYKEWRREEKKIPNHASQQKEKPIKTEVLWLNW